MQYLKYQISSCIKKMCVIALFLIIPISSQAALLTCPDFAGNKQPDLSQWSVLDGNPRGYHEFIRVRIPYKYVLGSNYAICIYSDNLIIYRFGTFSRGNLNVWSHYYIGGIGGWECSADRLECHFYN